MGSVRGSFSGDRESLEAARFLNESLHLILLPTERCNFRCVYCYESFNLGRMSEEVVWGVRNLLQRAAPGLRWLKIEWFGGEPLLAFEEIAEIQRGVAKLREGFPRLVFSAAMTTNGYLLNAVMLKRLVGLGVKAFQVALDGDEQAHDERRHLANGAGSWEVIYGNLREISGTDLEFLMTLRVHVDRQNAGRIERLLERLAEDFAQDGRIEVHFRPVSRLGGENDETLPVLGDAAEDILERLAASAEGLGLRVQTASERTPCYAAMPNSLVIRPNGQIAKCTVALDDPRNHVGQLHPDGRLELQRRRLRPWLRGLESGDLAALECPLETLQPSSRPVLPVVR